MSGAGETGSRDTSDYTVKAKLRDVEQLLRRATIKPYRVGGQTIGLRMTGLAKIKSARSLGIESGDVIRSVNGHRLTSKKRAYQVFKKGRSKSTMRVEFLRGNEVNTLLISFK
jgi:general secretion pathway protein C